MIPVPESEIIDFDLNSEGDLHYKLIVFKQAVLNVTVDFSLLEELCKNFKE